MPIDASIDVSADLPIDVSIDVSLGMLIDESIQVNKRQVKFKVISKLL